MCTATRQRLRCNCHVITDLTPKQMEDRMAINWNPSKGHYRHLRLSIIFKTQSTGSRKRDPRPTAVRSVHRTASERSSGEKGGKELWPSDPFGSPIWTPCKASPRLEPFKTPFWHSRSHPDPLVLAGKPSIPRSIHPSTRGILLQDLCGMEFFCFFPTVLAILCGEWFVPIEETESLGFCTRFRTNLFWSVYNSWIWVGFWFYPHFFENNLWNFNLMGLSSCELLWHALYGWMLYCWSGWFDLWDDTDLHFVLCFGLYWGVFPEQFLISPSWWDPRANA